MADQRLVQTPDGVIAFPADATDVEISAFLNAIPAENKAAAPKANTWTAIGMAATKSAAPSVGRAVTELATSPSVPRTAAKIGRVVGGVAPIIGGAAAGGSMGAAAASGSAAKGSWAGGKAGWFTGKMLQDMANPVARAAAAAAPYAQALGTASGAAGIGDLAQMAEPNRQDIGILGIGTGTPDPNHPALLNLLAMKLKDAVKVLMDKGLSRGDATRTIMNAKVKANR